MDVRIVRNLLFDLELSATAPKMGAKNAAINIEAPPAAPHIKSPKFFPYKCSGAITFVKNTGKDKDSFPSISGDIDTLGTIILLHGSSGRLERLQNYYYFIQKAARNNYEEKWATAGLVHDIDYDKTV